MGVGTIVMVTLFSACGGASLALGTVQAVSGRIVIGPAAWRASWTRGEIKLLGWSFALFGLATIATALLGGLEFGARVIPPYWVGSPWGLVTANPLAPVLLINLFIQGFIELRHMRRSRSKHA